MISEINYSLFYLDTEETKVSNTQPDQKAENIEISKSDKMHSVSFYK